MPPPHLLQDHQLARDMMLLDVGRPSWTVADARTRGGRTRAAAVRRPCPTRAPAVIYIYIYTHTHTCTYIHVYIHMHITAGPRRPAGQPSTYILCIDLPKPPPFTYIYIYYYIYITAGPRRPAGQPSTLYRQPSTLCQRVERAVSGSVLRGACDRVRSDFRRVHIHTHAAARTHARTRTRTRTTHTHTHAVPGGEPGTESGI